VISVPAASINGRVSASAIKQSITADVLLKQEGEIKDLPKQHHPTIVGLIMECYLTHRVVSFLLVGRREVLLQVCRHPKRWLYLSINMDIIGSFLERLTEP